MQKASGRASGSGSTFFMAENLSAQRGTEFRKYLVDYRVDLDIICEGFLYFANVIINFNKMKNVTTCVTW